MSRKSGPPPLIQAALATLLLNLPAARIQIAAATESSGAVPAAKRLILTPTPYRNLLVRCHIAPDKETWAADDVPRFRAYVRDAGGTKLELVTNPDLGCMVEIDDKWYAYAEQQWVDGFDRYFSDWIAENGGYLRFALDPLSLQEIVDGQALKLVPGKHKVRFAWAEHERKEPPHLISEPQTVIIQKPQLPLHPALKYDREREVRDLFLTFIGGHKSDEKTNAGLKFDIRLHAQWRPKFLWSDIPTLLELAESTRVMKENIPSNMISSYAAMECTEGMVALWLIEGLRRKQLDLLAQEEGLSYPGSNARWYYNLPFNPICRIEGVGMKECEKSEEIHRKTVEAYTAWWKKVVALPPREAAVVNPLGGTGTAWFGGVHPMDKASPADNAD